MSDELKISPGIMVLTDEIVQAVNELPYRLLTGPWPSPGVAMRQGPRTEQTLYVPARTATALMDRPKAAPFQMPALLPPREYLETAARVKLDSPKVLRARLEYFLATNGWPVYPYDRVWSYLEQLADQENQRVYGRQRDQAIEEPSITRSSWSRAPQINPYWAPLRSLDDSEDEPVAVYDKDVPLHALQKVEILDREFGEGVLQFFVSDYQATKPDPFLMVVAGNGRFVIDVWDEPGW
jgi:hypothetical protein